MSKNERTPLARTDVSPEMLSGIADTLNAEIIGELRRLAAKMKAKGVPAVAVTGMITVQKARNLLIGWIAATETTINKASRPIEEIPNAARFDCNHDELLRPPRFG